MTAQARQPAQPGLSRSEQAVRRERVRQVVEPVVNAAGCDLEDVMLSRAGRRHLLRVVIDADGGVSLDEVAEVSRAVSRALDAAEEVAGELFAGEYALEVGSPGVDRPLKLPRHWRRNVGRLVLVQVRPAPETVAGDAGAGGAGTVTGRVTAADETDVVLDVDGEHRRVPYDRLGPGRVQIEFSRLDEADDADLDDVDGSALDDVDGPDGRDDEDLEGER